MPLRARKALASVVAGEKVLDSIARPAIAIFGLIASDLQDEIRNTSVNALNKVLKKGHNKSICYKYTVFKRTFQAQ